jgi:pSer/pThr/pTyr-binding forkhead associated (FHA) protein
MPYLVVMDGPQQGRRFTITDNDTRIGRVVGNHVVLDSASVSSAHAELTRDQASFRLRDLDSTNGTRVNGHRITDTLLFRDDKILFGELPVVFSGEDAPMRDAPSTAPATVAPVPVPEPEPELEPEPEAPLHPSLTIASSASGKHAAAPLPRDFRKRRDTRKVWLAVIVILLVGIGIAAWKFYTSIFPGK